MTKHKKEEVHYARGHQHSHCGKSFPDDTYYCQHFRGHEDITKLGTCTQVEGPINPVFWCELFKKINK